MGKRTPVIVGPRADNEPYLGLLAQFRLQELIQHQLAFFGGTFRDFMARRFEMAGYHGVVFRLLDLFEL